MKQTIETQLDCRATASLQESVSNDMKEKDRSLASLMTKEADERNEDADETKSSD